MNNSKFSHNIDDLIKDLFEPDYITDNFSFLGINSLVVLSSVFRPDKSYLAGYFAKILKSKEYLYKGKSVLDLGCGSGLLGIICSLNGSNTVSFSDINPSAVKNAKLNSILLDLNNVSFYTGSLFESISTENKFDVIIFNPPSISGTPTSNAESALIREDKMIHSLYESFSGYLKDGGVVIMPGSSRFDGEMSPINMVKKLSLDFEIIDKELEYDENYKYSIKFTKREPNHEQ